MEQLTTSDLKALIAAQTELTARIRRQLEQAHRRIDLLEGELAAAKREAKTTDG